MTKTTNIKTLLNNIRNELIKTNDIQKYCINIKKIFLVVGVFVITKIFRASFTKIKT